LAAQRRAPFLAAYARLLRAYRPNHGEAEVWHRGDEMASSFFGPGAFSEATFNNEQVLDLEGFKGRLLSISYVPTEGEPGSKEMLSDVEEIFRKHQTSGSVGILYDTKVYYGCPTPRNQHPHR
jgi:hypothetical protein